MLYLPSQLERRRSHAFFLPPDWLAADVSLHHIPPFALGCLLALFGAGWRRFLFHLLLHTFSIDMYQYRPLSLSLRKYGCSIVPSWDGHAQPIEESITLFFFLLNFNCIFLFFVAFRRVLAIQIKWHVDRIDFFVLLVVKD